MAAADRPVRHHRVTTLRPALALVAAALAVLHVVTGLLLRRWAGPTLPVAMTLVPMAAGVLALWFTWRMAFRPTLHAALKDLHASRETARRSASEMQAFLDMLPEAVLIVQRRRVVYANRRAGELFCGEPAGGLAQGGTCLLDDLVDSAQRTEVHARLERVEAGECDATFQPRSLRRRDGTSFDALVGVSRVHFGGSPAVLKLVRNVDDANELQRRLERKRGELLALSRSLIEMQERERRHVARELHDEIGQALSAIRVQFAKLQRRIPDPDALALIDSAATLTERTLGRVRNLSLLLHPPQLQTLGLPAALRWHIHEQQRLQGTPIHFEESPIPGQLDLDLATAAYRIVQEALTNALRHGRPQRIDVRLGSDPQGLQLRIQDDGCGFTPDTVGAERPSLGLISMTERARLLGGELTVESIPGMGTCIAAALPWR